MRAALTLGLAVLPLPFVSALAAAQDSAPALHRFQQKEARLFHIGWRLVSANAPFCAERRSGVGLLLHDAASYGSPQAVMDTLGLSGPIGIQAVAPGSPAGLTGLTRNDTLVSIDERLIADWPFDQDARWTRMTAINDWLDERLAANKSVMLRWRSAKGMERETVLFAAPACPSRFELAGSGDRAVAEGTRVIFGPDFEGFEYDDDLLAAAIAHELAHNLLGHRARLDASGRGWSKVRETEREADRLAPWLLANAGYPPDAAIRFMQTWGPRNDGGLFRKRTHDGWDERVEMIEAEVPLVRAAVERTGMADWQTRFERTPD